MSEIWRNIIGYEDNYEVSSHGRVRNKKTNQRILKQWINCGGYSMITLTKNKKKKHFSIHRLVALLFIKNQENKTTVDHIDRNKLNNNVENLRWATRFEQTENRDIMNNALRIRLSEYNKYIVCFRKYNEDYCKSFDTEAEAIEWRDKKLIELAALNNDA